MKISEVPVLRTIIGTPQEALEGGSAKERAVSGWRPLVYMKAGNRTPWINEDLAPTPPALRVWNWWSYVSLWWGFNFSISGWSTGSALINSGLSISQTMGICVVGCFLTSSLGVTMARPGSIYHIGFPVLARSSFGLRGSKVIVSIRGIVAIIWYGVQTFYGASLLDQGLRAVFGDSWYRMPNHLPASSGTTTRFMIVYTIFWLIQAPCVMIHPTHARHIYTVKSFILPISAFAFLGALITRCGGSIDFSLIERSALSGAPLSWALLQGLNAIFGTIAPMLINQPDIARYANRPSASLLPQFFSMMLNKILVFFLGVVTAAASAKLFGQTVWNIWDLCRLLLDNNWTTGWRVGIAFFTIAQCGGTLATNVFSNSFPFGVDFSGVFPKRINIVRGQVICIMLSWASCPWLILTSGARFLTFLGSYTFFMAGVLGIMVCDYYVIRRGNLHIPSLFDTTPKSLYMPAPAGYNPRGLGTWVASSLIGIPGLAAAFGSGVGGTTGTAARLYNTGFILCFTAAFVIYFTVNKIWPVPIMPAEHADEPVTWESLGKSDGYFDGEETITFGLSEDEGEFGSQSGSRVDDDEEETGKEKEKEEGTRVTVAAV